MPSPHRADLSDADGPTLRTYLDWLRRRWWILVAAALLGTGAGWAVTQVQDRTYLSTTTLLVRQVGPDAGPGAKVNLDTEAQVVRSLVVAERARNLLRVNTSGEELVRSVSVTVPPNSQVLQISYEAATPTTAQAGSHSFAQAYLDLRLATANRALESETTALKQQIAQVTTQLGVVTGRLAAAPANSVDRARAEADRSVLTNQLASLNSRLTPLLTTALDPGEIISDAALPRRPHSPDRTLNLASGAGAGLLLGLAIALVLDRIDTRIRRGRDVTTRLGLPVLLELPDRMPAPAILPPTHPVARELGRLRNVLLSTVDEPTTPGRGRQLLVTGASAGPAAGFVAGNLAAAYARTGAQVAVVTTRPDSPLTAMLGAGLPRYTLADVLRREVGALAALTPAPGLNQLRVLLPGELETDIELPVAAVLEILDELAARFDHVLVETAQPSVAVEAQALARHMDGVVLVVENGQTRASELGSTLHQFEQVAAPVLGAVLTPRLPAPPPATVRPRPTGAQLGDAPAWTPAAAEHPAGQPDGVWRPAPKRSTGHRPITDANPNTGQHPTRGVWTATGPYQESDPVGADQPATPATPTAPPAIPRPRPQPYPRNRQPPPSPADSTVVLPRIREANRE